MNVVYADRGRKKRAICPFRPDGYCDSCCPMLVDCFETGDSYNCSLSLFRRPNADGMGEFTGARKLFIGEETTV